MKRVLTRLVTGACLVAASLTTVVAAGPGTAHADEGNCAGFPGVPQAYVCIVSLTPADAIPTVNTNGGTVIVPSFCYVLGCTPDTPVSTPSVTFGSGTIAVLTYNGQTYVVAADPTA